MYFSFQVPNCVGRKYAPIQGDLQNGNLYCSDENGTKILGSDFVGNRDCTKGIYEPLAISIFVVLVISLMHEISLNLA